MMEPIKLTHKSIEPYGSLLSESNAEPVFKNEHFEYTAGVHVTPNDHGQTIGILKSFQREMKIDTVEKHNNTGEILIQIENDAILFLCEASVKKPQQEDMKPFSLKQGDAVLLNKGVWHWVPFPTGRDCKTLIVYKDKTSENDTVLLEIC